MIILCYPHHIETNDVDEYPPERLREMKAAHEQSFEKNPFKIDESVLYKIAREMDEYWERVDQLHRYQHVASDHAVEIDATATFVQLAEQAKSLARHIWQLRESLVISAKELPSDIQMLLRSVGVSEAKISELDLHIERFGFRDWEVVNLGLITVESRLLVVLAQMEVKYLEEYVKLNPNELAMRLRLEALKKEFEGIAVSAGLAD